MPEGQQVNDAARALLHALGAADDETKRRLRQALGVEAATAPIDRDFIRRHIIPELELYWRRQGGTSR